MNKVLIMGGGRMASLLAAATMLPHKELSLSRVPLEVEAGDSWEERDHAADESRRKIEAAASKRARKAKLRAKQARKNQTVCLHDGDFSMDTKLGVRTCDDCGIVLGFCTTDQEFADEDNFDAGLDA